MLMYISPCCSWHFLSLNRNQATLCFEFIEFVVLILVGGKLAIIAMANSADVTILARKVLNHLLAKISGMLVVLSARS